MIETTPPPAKPSRRPLWIALAALLAVAVLAGGGYLAWTLTRPTYITLSGQVVIVDNDATVAHFQWDETPLACHGTGKYADITKGGPLTIRDEKGETLAVAALAEGTPGGFEPGYNDLMGAYRRATTCTFNWKVVRIVERDFYQAQPGQQPVVMVQAGQDVRVMLNG